MAAALGDLLLAADRVGEQGVTAVDDDVAVFHGVGKLLNHGVRRRAGLDHDDGLARALKGGDEVLDGFGGDEVALVAVRLDDRAGLLRGAVEDGHSVALGGEVAREVGAHDGHPHDADLGELVTGSHG